MHYSSVIFLISQPRSGSTLTQRLLGAHKEIYTASESWLMLAPIYALRTSGIQTEYGHDLSRIALQEFLKTLPNGDDEYWSAVERMYGYLYSRVLENRSELFFLDKTPRYYYIISELLKIFPYARQLLLIRNPLAVLSSIRRTWCMNDWGLLAAFKDDLFKAPHMMAQACSDLKFNQKVIHYEKIVSETDQSLSDIFNWLNLAPSDNFREYNNLDQKKWKFGDQGLVYNISKPLAERATVWKKDMADPQFWRCAKEYVDMLGDDILKTLGYSPASINAEIISSKPTLFSLWRTKPLTSFIGHR